MSTPECNALFISSTSYPRSTIVLEKNPSILPEGPQQSGITCYLGVVDPLPSLLWDHSHPAHVKFKYPENVDTSYLDHRDASCWIRPRPFNGYPAAHDARSNYTRPRVQAEGSVPGHDRFSSGPLDRYDRRIPGDNYVVRVRRPRLLSCLMGVGCDGHCNHRRRVARLRMISSVFSALGFLASSILVANEKYCAASSLATLLLKRAMRRQTICCGPRPEQQARPPDLVSCRYHISHPCSGSVSRPTSSSGTVSAAACSTPR